LKAHTNAYAERWVRSVKEECLSKLILFGEASLLGIPMMSISHSDLMPISSERSDAGLSQCETVIDIRQGFLSFS
jgi:hypothetical protein